MISSFKVLILKLDKGTENSFHDQKNEFDFWSIWETVFFIYLTIFYYAKLTTTTLQNLPTDCSNPIFYNSWIFSNHFPDHDPATCCANCT